MKQPGIIWKLPTMTRNALLNANYTEEMLEVATDQELLKLYSLSKVGLQHIRELQGRRPAKSDNQRTADRLWIAGVAMQGLLKDGDFNRHVAEKAVKMADWLLEELGR
jgi:hypothetical protein